jgi:hypothetical protein
MLRNIPEPEKVAKLLADALEVYQLETGDVAGKETATALRPSDRPRVVRLPAVVVAAE